MDQKELNDLLLEAAKNCRYIDIQNLIDKGAKLFASDDNGNTALHKAAEQGHLGCARLLIQHGANVHIKNKYGSTPLHFSVIFHQLEVVQLLVKHGANPLEAANNGVTPLSLAKSEGNRKSMADFLEMVVEKIKLDSVIVANDNAQGLEF